MGGNLDGYYGWYSAEAIAFQEANSKTFDTFRSNIELGAHAAVHVGCGGSMLNQNQAANGILYFIKDPLFFLHHAMIDKVWLDWQKTYPNASKLYQNDAGTTVIDGGKKMFLYGLRAKSDRTYTASQMLNTGAGYPLCYVYSESVALAVSTAVKRDITSSKAKGMKLKCPMPLQKQFENQIYIPKEERMRLRQNQADLCQYIQHLNSIDTYVSPAIEILNTPIERRVWIKKSQMKNREQKKGLRKMVTDFSGTNIV